ncbi:2-C-methyl-D-erythritol 4-phosphate cytidylyltransferase [Alicyclobacillus fodiniaquatilis]|uniref:Ribitol-5-phosphate cytidylyltransferase n=1 Tax=Alicyclobacillus fodiniaquatilis TaxID=1661150 RepID=A0ABW4JJG5_9BACL
MIFTMILAGGKGNRMGNKDIPKQFLILGDKPIIIHTIEKFLLFNEINEVIALCPKEWLIHTKNLLHKHCIPESRVTVVEGGDTRHRTIQKGISFLQDHRNASSNDIIITHDAVRPFVSYRIIKENIEQCVAHGAVDTVIPATDTIVRSEDGRTLNEIPPRQELYQGQTPQSFRIGTIIDSYRSLESQEIEMATDAAKIALLNGKDVYIVIGESTNLKITTPSDLLFANAILKEGVVK